MKQRVTIFFSVFFGIILVVIWLYIVNLKEMFDVFLSGNIYLILPVALLFILIYFLRSLRWKIILSPIERITAIESFKLCMTNYFINFLIPIHAGEVAKCLILKKMKGTSASKSLLTAYIDKLADVVPIFLLLVVTPFLSSEINSLIYLISGVLFLVFLFIVIFLMGIAHKKEVAFTLIEKLIFFLPSKLKMKFRKIFALFVEAVATLPQLSNRLAEIIVLTLLALILHCLMLWLFFYAFGVTLPVVTLFVGYLLLNASFILPAPPGFSGSLELTVLFIFSYLFGYDKNIISAVAATSHVFTAILFAIFGLLSIALIGTRLSALIKIESEESMDIEEIKASD